MIFLKMKEFQTRAVHIFDDVKYSKRKKCHVWLVPALFNYFRHINELAYQEAERTSLMVQEENGRNANVESVQTIDLESLSKLN